MAIDRGTKYVCQWESDAGWAMMLEIIPPGDFMGIEVFDVVYFSHSLFSMDASGYGLEDLPFGMMKSPAISFEFEKFGGLPSGLKELIITPEYDAFGVPTTTIFALWTDEGLGGDLFIQYIGAQARTLGNKFRIAIDSDTVRSVKIETFDLLKTILDAAPANSVLGSGNTGQSIIENSSFADAILDNVKLGDFNNKVDVLPTPYFQFMYTIPTFTEKLGGFIGVQLAYWLRSGLFGLEQTTAFDTYPTTSLTFYTQTYTTPGNTKGYVVDETGTYKLHILGHIASQVSGTTYESHGGFFSRDKEGVSEFDSISTFINQLCENLICKFKWKPIVQHNATSDTDILSYEVCFLKPLENYTTPTTFSGIIIGDGYDITTAENVFLVAESETTKAGDKNVSLNRVSITTSNKTDAFSTKFLLHNSPTVPPPHRDEFGSEPYYVEQHIYPRKIYYNEGTFWGKVHDSVTINDGITTIDYDDPIAYPSAFTDHVMITGWANETQNTNSLQQAIAEYITTYWSSREQSIREFTCKMVGGEGDGSIMPRHACDVFTLPAITELSVGQTSVLLDVKPDWNKGTVTCKFLSIKDRE